MYATISRIPDTFMGQIIIEQILKLVNSSISFQIHYLEQLNGVHWRSIHFFV